MILVLMVKNFCISVDVNLSVLLRCIVVISYLMALILKKIVC